MQAFFDAVGGRANLLVLLVLTILCANDFVTHGSLQDATINNLLVLAGIGVTGRTVEDVGKAIATRNQATPVPKKKK